MKTGPNREKQTRFRQRFPFLFYMQLSDDYNSAEINIHCIFFRLITLILIIIIVFIGNCTLFNNNQMVYKEISMIYLH